MFIVAAVRLYREGVARLIRDDASLRLVGLGPPDDHSLRKIAAVAPRVVLVDVGETRIGTFVRRLAAATPGYGVIAIGIQEEDETVVECAEVGVRGYLERDASLTELAQAVRDLAKGELHCPPRIAAILFRNIGAAASRDRAGNALSHLTGREREIVGLIDRGLTNKEIAAALAIEVATVKNHVHHVLEKMGVPRRAAAAAKLRLDVHEHKDLVRTHESNPT